MLDRNRRVKEAPQKFQTCTEQFDVIICLEERVYDQVYMIGSSIFLVKILEDLQTRESCNGQSVHVINIDIQDNHEEVNELK
jgi:RNA polymerase II subunit A C-terminal domain phosphatase SSU72